MGYLRKYNTIANPARKNGTTFQNSYTATEQYETGYWIYDFEQTYISAWAVYKKYYENGRYVRREKIGDTNTDGYWNGQYVNRAEHHPTYGTRTVTKWNTRWHKLSA